MGVHRRTGLKVFRDAGAPGLGESGIMSAPVFDPMPGPELMEQFAGRPGGLNKVLYRDGDTDGMSLVWVYFAPHYVLPRHSHDGDCLYYVLAGELRMGNQVVPAGDGFFVPADAPYGYTAGADGVEVLEFRSKSRFGMRVGESIERWQQIVTATIERRDDWAAAANDRAAR
jgi:quercetin dioxygenase-like cupin family protein